MPSTVDAPGRQDKPFWLKVPGQNGPLPGYLELRRSLGFSLPREEKLLGQFITLLERRAWVTLPAGASPGWRFRMQAVRGFAAYLQEVSGIASVRENPWVSRSQDCQDGAPFRPS